ncbi:hypothetical protein PsAD2_00623 [Pseudovibrio axinellae]|uniref:Uncharacterized protein n=1 Tax=Pseudovibrio axinellae TaxID=989403 RepID=A0A166AN53_9HYPH|nr:hypothetical protein [Pseudovibrio axinellae]KZL21332.1 hypothetical protein PsAD2_00623 [Pseudovibrio axinellae]SEQ96443.1 Permuted papain-like amidase enzyme, YaeF/YiiX, C92 family [Pseudovibrio axinellae]
MEKERRNFSFLSKACIYLFALGILSSTAIENALPQDSIAPDFANWSNAQLIFVESTSPLESAVANAMNSPYAHVGILRLTGGGPVVLDTKPSLWEILLETFLNKTQSHRYAIYEVRGLSETNAYIPPRLANEYLHTPNDYFWRSGSSELSGAELVNLTYKAVGFDLGTPIKINEIGIHGKALYEWLKGRWKDHPDCNTPNLSLDDCWQHFKQQKVITPASIAADQRLVCVWSTFPSDRNRCPGPRYIPAKRSGDTPSHR